ncbi:hypothetical protein M7775_08680 [Sporomusa sphaeroides DSM 2875]|uniref:hypothetical protein n=1 Tax=Sporomusa sphaeroides TaxID=47679 RepID=UPI00202FB0EB|nr:hypothetical protein [Sporomusa sphaeroides]MCM0758642.1 hypothetical protein [Sporomusa sphaeroides DSM 2875]
MKWKIGLCLLAFVVSLIPTVSAQIQPIIWSESIRKTEKPVTTLLNLSDYMVIKSDRTLSINLGDGLPITAIDFRPDNNQTVHMNKQDFLFNIHLSDSLDKILNIPFGETKFN